jgi:protein-S-isoprenylcysteine O-methyltransferase Ste14
MKISKYQKLFGVGLLGAAINFAVLGLFWLLDRKLGHVQILSQAGPIRMLGLILVGLWICWQIWCVRTIRLWWRDDRLCTSGPYRFVRHPMYAGGVVLGFLGISLMLNSWIILLSPVLQYLVTSILVRKEEAIMAAVFGEDYRRYAARTGRLFPRLLIR